MHKEIVVLGDGGWGTTCAILLSKKGHNVTLWGAFPEHIALLRSERVNRKFLPGVEIPDTVRFASSKNELSDKAVYVVAIPSKHLRKTIAGFKGKIKGGLISLTKGIETETLLRPSEILGEVLGNPKIAVLSGPSISFEVARSLPTTVVAASRDASFANEAQSIFTTENFRVYTTDDLAGVELGGALKNIIAIAAGIADGLGFGVNTKAALLTRGLVEIIRLGVKVGARKETFFGLSGLGDLATTCMSKHSRNRKVGEEIGGGKKLKSVLTESEMISEGVTTTKSAYELSKKFAIEMPITEKIYEVLYKNKEPKVAVTELMKRSLKAELI
ncbi:MAG: NAD(P)-dependent glycerol-3-phosphate dehydrogenase [Omnitrophica bacterium]|nr:NAD(P)-dependent glycerol-3-phosphate dehydrogenase [Candidatus Omnitrophota bacterium]